LRLALTYLPAVLFWQRCSLAAAQPVTNLAVMQELAASIGRQLAGRIGGQDTVTVSMAAAPEATAWVIQGPVRQALMARPAALVVRGAQYGVDCAVAALSVRYENSRRTWLFGTREVDRIVEVSLDCTVTDARAGGVLLAETIARSRRDTIDVSAIPALEEQGVSFTRGALPPEGFFSWAAEPLIMIGAIAVSVYLLFHVRS
jgi:hypothetical protein